MLKGRGLRVSFCFRKSHVQSRVSHYTHMHTHAQIYIYICTHTHKFSTNSFGQQNFRASGNFSLNSLSCARVPKCTRALPVDKSLPLKLQWPVHHLPLQYIVNQLVNERSGGPPHSTALMFKEAYFSVLCPGVAIEIVTTGRFC